ncbi:hypothetical protein GCM10022221_36030 [Actinocorallia aurea]
MTVLGASGSGKTVYLSSLHKRLSIERPDTGFFVELPPQQQTRLSKIYREVSTGRDWPRGTGKGDGQTWNFTCAVKTTSAKTFHPFSIDYLDYAGELITEPQEDGETTDAAVELFEKIRTSDFLLVLLDGEKVIDFLDGGGELRADLAEILPLAGRSNAVVHFVLTKWDLFDGLPFTLGDVVSRLRAEDDVADFLATRQENPKLSGTVRLIPVSAVGSGFTRPGELGFPVKTGQQPRPLNVEIPFMAVVGDLIEQALADAADAVETDPADRPTQRRERLRGVVKLIRTGLPLIEVAIKVASRYAKVPESVTKVCVTLAGEALKHGEEWLNRSVADLRKDAKNSLTEQEALERLFDLFGATLRDFEKNHPESRLTESFLP